MRNLKNFDKIIAYLRKQLRISKKSAGPKKNFKK